MAVIAVGFSAWLWPRKPLVRWLSLPGVGWLSGWLSFVPFASLALDNKGSLTLVKDLPSFVWPSMKITTEALLLPYLCFGLVGVVYFFLLTICQGLAVKRLSVHLLLGSVSGTLGSLGFWLPFEPWYLSVLHGTTWGTLVGLGMWKSQLASPGL